MRLQQSAFASFAPFASPSFVRREKRPPLRTTDKLLTENTTQTLVSTRICHPCVGFGRKVPLWEQQTELTKAGLVRAERGRAQPLDGCSLLEVPTTQTAPLNYNLFYFSYSFTEDWICCQQECVTEQQPSPHRPWHPCCQGELVPCGSPLTLSTSRPTVLTWPLALAAAGSAAAFPSAATPPLDNWAPIFFPLGVLNKK